MSQSAGKTWCYLLGVYMGDGCVTTSNGYPVFRLNTIDEDFAQATKVALQEFTQRPIWIGLQPVKGGRPQYQLRCGDPDICRKMVEQTNGKQKLPDGWELWADDEKKAFTVGLMDSEGFVAEKTEGKTGRAYYMGFKSCGLWIRDFVRLMQSFGLLIGKVSDCPPNKPGYQTPTRFHIKMKSWVECKMRFNIERKQSRVDRWASTEPYSERKRHPRQVSSETARLAA